MNTNKDFGLSDATCSEYFLTSVCKHAALIPASASTDSQGVLGSAGHFWTFFKDNLTNQLWEFIKCISLPMEMY